jgi:hypothetical protein
MHVVCMPHPVINGQFTGALKAGDIGISIASKESSPEAGGATGEEEEAEAAVTAAPSIAAPFATGDFGLNESSDTLSWCWHRDQARRDP